jgi:hypothetical protein
MAGTLTTQTISAPWGGYDTETADAHISANKSRLLKNLLPGRPGKAVLRGPLRRPRDTDSAAVGASTTFSGGWVFDDKLLHADMDTNPVGYMVTDWSGVNPTLSAKVNPASLNVGLYPFHARGGNFVYGYTAGAQGVSGLPSPNRRTAGGSGSDPGATLLRWTGGATAGDFVAYGAATHPRGAVDVRTFLNRIFVLGGSEPGTTTPVFTTRLYWSLDLADGTVAIPDAVASWQSGGVTNRIVLEGTGNDYGVGMAILNGRLVILRRQSLYMMTGSDPSTFAVRKIASVGCVDPGSILEWDDGVYFLSDTGLMFFDGSQVLPIGDPIAGEIAAAAWQGATVSELSMARISAQHFLMCSTGSIRKAWLYHVPSRSWAELTADTSVIAGGAPRRISRVVNYPLVYDGTYIYDASFVALPEAADANTQAGRDRSGFSGTDVVIPGEMLTRTFKLSAPEDKSQMHRMLVDYALKAPPGVTSGTLEWDITVEDGRGNVLRAGIPFLGDYAGGELVRVPPKRRREVRESVRLEVTEVAFHWRLNAAAPSWPAYAEIQDSALQYETTRWRGVD